MRKLISLTLLVAAAAIAGCGGGGTDAFGTPGTGGGTGTGATVAALAVTTTSPTILADGSTTATITALARDSGNNLLKGVTVTFAASSGGLAVVSGTTDASGAATATLSTAGDSTLRLITVTATAGGKSASVAVSVVAPPPPATAATLTLITSTPTIQSGGTSSADITAIARNSSNQFVAGVAVTFTASSGGLTVVQGTTDASGVAKATLTAAGDPTNRRIVVTATSGAVSQTVNVDVTGTAVKITGPAVLQLSQTGSYIVNVANAAGAGIAGTQVTLASANGNTVSPATATTDASGNATLTVTVTKSGNDVLTASALGIAKQQPVTINSDAFAFTAPATNTEIALSPATGTVTLQWLQSGNPPAAGQTISLSSTRGTVTPASITTDGVASTFSATVSSANAGFATVRATAGASSAQLNVEFVAQTAASIDVQSSSFTIAPAEQATITAVVRDPANNLVKNKTVNFSLNDVSGGSLSLASAVTDSNGRAQTVYTAGAGTTANNGVAITATVQGTPSVTKSVQLTVARRQVFISIGTGNTITEPNAAQYQIDYIIQVTDSNGNGVKDVPLTVSMLSLRYLKGFRAVVGTSWTTCYTTVPGTPSTRSPLLCNGDSSTGCFDEDTNRNGVLDPGEDLNGSGRIEAGNIATVTPNNVITDASGFALVSVFYPQEYAYYLWAAIEAKTSVQGTEFARQQTFLLPGAASDFRDPAVAPPGTTSPFGQSSVCSNTL
jgi:hypothetical protein